MTGKRKDHMTGQCYDHMTGKCYNRLINAMIAILQSMLRSLADDDRYVCVCQDEIAHASEKCLFDFSETPRSHKD